MPPAGNLACSQGICPDGELNQQPFCLWDDAQPTEPHQSGLYIIFVKAIDLANPVEGTEYSFAQQCHH